MKDCCGNRKDVSRNQKNSQRVHKPKQTHVTTTQTIKKEITTVKNIDPKYNSNIRASKFYGADDVPESNITKTGYQKVASSKVRGELQQTRPQNYAVQSNTLTKSQVSRSIQQLDFTLDQDLGVSNTFQIPTFDYVTILSHNIYANKNSRIMIPDHERLYHNQIN